MTFKVLLHHYGRFTSPPGRKFVDGLVATVDPVELDNFSTNQVKLILTNSLGYDFNSQTFLYLRNPNCSLDSGLIPLANAIQDCDMLLTYAQTHQNRCISGGDILTCRGRPMQRCEKQKRKSRKTFLFKKRTVLIPNDGSLEESFRSMASSSNEARKTIVSKLQRELEAEATFANQLLCNLTRYREQMRIREIQMTMMQNMPTTSLNSYGLHALLMTHEADIRTTNNLIRARQELLRSIAEKQNFINSYMAI
ncbi:hypothetical protein Tco_0768770 [Tanacetum coccineum]